MLLNKGRAEGADGVKSSHLLSSPDVPGPLWN